MLQIKLLFLLFFTKVHICWVKELKCNLEANKNVVIWDTSHGHVTVSGHKKIDYSFTQSHSAIMWSIIFLAASWENVI